MYMENNNLSTRVHVYIHIHTLGEHTPPSKKVGSYRYAYISISRHTKYAHTTHIHVHKDYKSRHGH